MRAGGEAAGLLMFPLLTALLLGDRPALGRRMH